MTAQATITAYAATCECPSPHEGTAVWIADEAGALAACPGALWDALDCPDDEDQDDDGADEYDLAAGLDPRVALAEALLMS